MRYILLGLAIGVLLIGAHDALEWYRTHLFLP